MCPVKLCKSEDIDFQPEENRDGDRIVTEDNKYQKVTEKSTLSISLKDTHQKKSHVPVTIKDTVQ